MIIVRHDKEATYIDNRNKLTFSCIKNLYSDKDGIGLQCNYDSHTKEYEEVKGICNNIVLLLEKLDVLIGE